MKLFHKILIAIFCTTFIPVTFGLFYNVSTAQKTGDEFSAARLEKEYRDTVQAIDLMKGEMIANGSLDASSYYSNIRLGVDSSISGNGKAWTDFEKLPEEIRTRVQAGIIHSNTEILENGINISVIVPVRNVEKRRIDLYLEYDKLINESNYDKEFNFFQSSDKIEVFNAEGYLAFSNIFDSFGKRYSDGFTDKKAVSETLAAGATVFEKQQLPSGDKYNFIIAPLYDGDRTIGTVVIGKETNEAEKIITMFKNNSYTFTFLLLIFVVVTTFLITKMVIVPVEKIEKYSVKVAEGDANELFEIRGNDELARLTGNLNKMVEKIKQEMKNKQELAKRILENEIKAHYIDEIEKKNRKIMDSIEYAKMIQLAILPKPVNYAEAFADHFVIWKPRDLVGGDFHWLRKNGDNILAAVIDCTGHGVPGAFMTMAVNSILDRVYDSVCRDNPARMLKELNALLKSTLHKTSLSRANDDGLDIGLCLIDARAKTLTFAGAKISLFYLDSGGLVEVKGDRQSIGYMRSKPDFEYKNNVIACEGKSFLMSSDGFFDQNGGENGVPYRKKRFIELVELNRDKSFAGIKDVVLQDFLAYKGENSQRDDITVMGFTL